jgi:hypothetical protein
MAVTAFQRAMVSVPVYCPGNSHARQWDFFEHVRRGTAYYPDYSGVRAIEGRDLQSKGYGLGLGAASNLSHIVVCCAGLV